MIVKIIKTGELKEFDPSYGARLIEQGIAVPAPAPATPKSAEAPATKKGGKSGDA